MSDDEFDELSLPDLTAEDLAFIDALSGPSRSPLLSGREHISIEVESLTDTNPKASFSGVPAKESPLRRHRPRGTLSVTDLVSPLWCEYQFGYGLRQRRSKQLDQRPDSFVSTEGKEIFVQKQQAVRNDRKMKKGQAVHKQLEREINPFEVQVVVTTEEEKWGLRLLNMISSLDSLVKIGCCREMPVFGIIHDHIVIGVIDELLRKPHEPKDAPSQEALKRSSPSLHLTPKKAKKSRILSPSQTQLPTSFSISPHTITTPDFETILFPLKSNSDESRLTHSLHLSDTKTRSSSLPSHADSQGSRLQLMIYRRLLDMLISPSPLFDFASIWTRLNLNPRKKFSQRFIEEAESILLPVICDIYLFRPLPSTSHQFDCLEDICAVWNSSLEKLRVGGVDSTLTLVYRSRSKRKKTKRVKRGKKDTTQPAGSGSTVDHLLAQEEIDIATAIQASLQDMPPDPFALSPETPTKRGSARQVAPLILQVLENIINDTGGGTQTADAQVNNNREYTLSEQSNEVSTRSKADNDVHVQDRVDMAALLSLNDDSSASSSSHSTPFQSNIIGCVKFEADDEALDAHLLDVLDWWSGRRPPRGVELAQTARCFTCEYSDGCEWRERKAMEFMAGQKINVDSRLVHGDD